MARQIASTASVLLLLLLLCSTRLARLPASLAAQEAAGSS
jgi:hypothetical protein